MKLHLQSLLYVSLPPTMQQLREMNHFCTGENVFNIVGVDEKFNLGPFFMTVMTYMNSMVENETNHKMHTFIGPIYGSYGESS